VSFGSLGPIEGKSFRSPRASGFISFDERQKKRTKEKRFPRNGTSSRLRQDRDFPTRHPWLGRKTPHILCGALRVW
jgi:hypothetical protein